MGRVGRNVGKVGRVCLGGVRTGEFGSHTQQECVWQVLVIVHGQA